MLVTLESLQVEHDLDKARRMVRRALAKGRASGSRRARDAKALAGQLKVRRRALWRDVAADLDFGPAE